MKHHEIYKCIMFLSVLEAVVNKTDSQKPSDVEGDDEDDGDDVEQGLEGSADQPLDF